MIVAPGLIRGTSRYTRGRQIFSQLNPTRYVEPGVLASPFTITRAQTAGVESSGLSSDGVTWNLYGADTARFFGTEQLLAIETQRQNAIRNPRFQGTTPGIVGAGGVIPTRFVYQQGTNHTLEIIGVTTVNGLPTLEVEFVATDAGQSVFSFELSSGVGLSANSAYPFTVFAALTGGSLTNVDSQGIRFRVDATVAADGPLVPLLNLGPSLQRYDGIFLTAASGQTAGRIQYIWESTGAATTRLQFAAPMIDRAFANYTGDLANVYNNTPIFPPVGTLTTTTRGVDNISAALGDLGLSNLAQGTGCTVLWAGRFFKTSTTSFQTILAVDDGLSSPLDRIESRLTREGTIELVHTIGGVLTLDTVRPAFVPAGQFVKVGMSIDPAGQVATVFSGFSNDVAITAGPAAPSTPLTTLRLGGSTASGGRPLLGETKALYVAPTALNATDLSAALMAMPV